MEALSQVIPQVESTEGRLPRLFTARRRLDVKPAVCPGCEEITVYVVEEISSDTDGTGQGFYMYHRPSCQCEREAAEWEHKAEKAVGEKERHARLLRMSRVDSAKLLHGMSLGGFKQDAGNQDAVDTVREWLRGWPQGRGLIFYGSWGVGKTHLSVGMVRALVNKLVHAEFWSACDLLDSLRVRKGEDTPRREILDFAKVNVLAIDDLGKERLTDWGREQLFRLVDQRYLQERPMITTTNLDPDALAERIGPAVVSRLIGSSEWVEIQGVDRRIESNWQDVD